MGKHLDGDIQPDKKVIADIVESLHADIEATLKKVRRNKLDRSLPEMALALADQVHDAVMYGDRAFAKAFLKSQTGDVTPANQPITTAASTRIKHQAGILSAKCKSHAGRKADTKFNYEVAAVVKPFGVNWRSHLDDICNTLRKKKVRPRLTPKWKKEGCKSWKDILEVDSEGLVKALQHRLDWVEKHPPASLFS